MQIQPSPGLVGAFACLAAMLATPLAYAQSPGNSARGQTLSEIWCSSCHVVSARSRPATDGGGPTFQAIARHRTTTATGLRVFLQTPHPRMPNDVLSVAQTEDIIAYILSLKR
jgi:mono/diheme cytochrome c family protein